MAIVANAIEILPKIWTAWVGRTNVADDRQTDGRATANSESAKKTCLKLLFALCYRLPWNNGFQTVAILPTTAYVYRHYTLHVKHISLWLPLIKAADSTRRPPRWHIDHKKWLMSRNGFRCIMRRRDETRVKKSVGRPSLTECFIVAGDTLRDWPLTARHCYAEWGSVHCQSPMGAGSCMWYSDEAVRLPTFSVPNGRSYQSSL